MRFRSILRVIALTLVTITFAHGFAACGGKQRSVVSLQSSDNLAAPPDQVYPPGRAATEPSLESALGELAALEAPDGVDPDLFTQLKDALTSLLTTNNQKPTTTRFASTPPTGDENRVTDLTLTDNGGGNYVLWWHYRNLGDYDQNGTVGISDITPIAMHYNETYDRDMEPDCLLAVIDGSANGEIDIADITPIAMNYGVDCVGYDVEGSDSPIVSFSFIQEALLNEATGEGRLEFSADLDELSWGYYRVSPYDSEGAEGIPSNIISATEPPTVISVAPITGATGSELSIVAVVTGARPLVYAWDFGDGAEPNTSNEEAPTVILGEVGDYAAILTVANDFGLDEYEFTLTVGLPPDIVGIYPQHGSPGSIVTFTASAYGTKPFEYSWDFGGGAMPNNSSDAQPYVILSPGGEYEVSVTISNDYGVDTFDFTLLVGVPHIWHVAPTAGPTGHAVVFSANVFGDEPLTYEWDFGGGADPDNTSEVSPEVVLGEVGEYDASLTLTNEHGSDEYLFLLQCGNLPEIVGVTPTEGETGLESTFEVEVIGTPPFTYEWDFGGAAEPNESNEEQPTVMMLDMGDYEVSVTVTDLFGSSEYAFPFHVGGWHSLIVDSGSGWGSGTSLAIVNGNPAISYVQEYVLRFVRSTNPQGTAWDDPIAMDPECSYYSSLAVINGKPAIAYGRYGALKYLHATDAGGGTWDDAIVVDSAPAMVVSAVTLCIVNGNPAIGYTNGKTWEVKYVRAQDQDGAVWDEPQSVASNSPYGCTLAVVNGNPAISYHERIDSENGRLRYMRALDADGSSWGESVVTDDEGNATQTCLAVISGNPAISYTDHASGGLKYVRALDKNGFEWAAPVLVSAGYGSSLAVANDIPSIGYSGHGSSVLEFVSAADSTGSHWFSPVWIETAQPHGISLINLSDRPAISYYENYSGSLKFAWYY